MKTKYIFRLYTQGKIYAGKCYISSVFELTLPRSLSLALSSSIQNKLSSFPDNLFVLILINIHHSLTSIPIYNAN